jgi:hypothetical protein
MYHIIIEQTKEYQNRMKYDPRSNSFFETEYQSHMHIRKFPYPYGWIKESGTPPEQHLDIIFLSEDHYNLGDESAIKIIGCFVRNDGDNKFIGISPERPENDFCELPEYQVTDLQRLYPRVDPGEGWFGAMKASLLIEQFMTNAKTEQV